MSNIVSIHQSQYLPWPPYFKKIYHSDIFVLLDDVQFHKNGVQNRNKIRSKANDYWLTIPVANKLKENINEKKITQPSILKKHWKAIEQSYSNSLNWEKYKEELYVIYHSKYNLLNELNVNLISFFLAAFDIKTPVIKSSDYKISASKSELVLQLCKVTNAKVYLSGTGSKNYLDEKLLLKEGIEVKYIKSETPIYQQCNENFILGLSALDFLMNTTKKEQEQYFNM